MYLRLKPYALDSRPSPTAPHNSDAYSLQPSTALLIKQRLVQNFDWRAGGPKSLIKYIDLHVIEYLVAETASSDKTAAKMLTRYINGVVKLFVPELGLVCQYSTGIEWNNRNRKVTLGGQAVALRALSLAARCNIVQHSFPWVGEIARVLAQSISKMLMAQSPRFFLNRNHTVSISRRDWWWAIAAAHSYAVATANRAMRVSLEARFDQQLAKSTALTEGSDRALKNREVNADNCLAFAAAMRQFGETRRDYALIEKASSCLVAASREFCHCSGGYMVAAATGSANASVDIDVSIEFVRLAARVYGLFPSSELVGAMRHGIGALANPLLAVARPWDAGILLADEAYSACDGGLVPSSIRTLDPPPRHDAVVGHH